MKRIILYIVLLCVPFLAPVTQVNVGTLKPVEVIALSREGNMLMVRTDTGDQGVGEDLKTAVLDMKQRSTGVIYLKTARYLLYTPKTQVQARQLRTELHKFVKMYPYDGSVDLREAAAYLRVHGTAENKMSKS